MMTFIESMGCTHGYIHVSPSGLALNCYILYIQNLRINPEWG
jgi:hypothetical protein